MAEHSSNTAMTVTLTVRAPEELVNWYDSFSRLTGLSRNMLIKIAMNYAIDHGFSKDNWMPRGNTTTITIRVGRTILHKYDAFAAATGNNRNKLIRMAMENAVDRRKEIRDYMKTHPDFVDMLQDSEG